MVFKAALLTLGLLAPVLAAPITELETRSPNNSKKVIASLFGWNWVSIGNECSFLASAGYGYVQVGTAMEHIQGSQWWTDYQAVSYKIQNKRGSRTQFKNMVSQCHSHNVKVIVDVIFNHMAGIDGGTGVAGSSFSHFNYPGLYTNGDFHHCGLAPNDEITDWNSEAQVETCMLENLADLNTESTSVRNKIAGHANDLISLGVDGFRVDAAKHINANSINAIAKKFSKSMYLTQEVVDTTSRWVDMHEAAGDVQEFRFAYLMKSAFNGNNIASLKNINSEGFLPSGKANVFVANHDTERGGSSLNYNSGSAYTLAHVFMLAAGYGTPTVHSGFSFSNTDMGAPNNGGGYCSGSGPTGGYECQHRWTAIAHMVGFYNTAGSNAITHMTTNGGNQIAFGRGSVGSVAINNAGSAWKVTLTTSLPNGSYCDIINGQKSGSKCTGATIKVSGGKFSVTVNAHSAIAIYTGAKL
ncbi:glycoside hydrolase [Clavulina sp. PMI_390]|nr:glycoside hydrolase [Clavulina sp. PMI_390]